MSEFAIYTLEEIQKRAADKNCEVVEALPNQLQIDIDDLRSMNQYYLMFEEFQEQLGLHEIERWESSGGNTHIVVGLREDTPIQQRILLQACLGSDRKREILSYLYTKNGAEHSVVLFKPKGGTQ